MKLIQIIAVLGISLLAPSMSASQEQTKGAKTATTSVEKKATKTEARKKSRTTKKSDSKTSQRKKVENKNDSRKKSDGKSDERLKIESKSDARKYVPGEWVIIKVDDKVITGDERPYLTFDESCNRFYGNNGCNTVNGDYKLDGNNKIRMSNVISTMRLCPEAPYQYQINNALDKARTYSIYDKGNESYMVLYSDKGATILELRKHNMEYLNGSWQITSVNGQIFDREEYPELQIVLDIPELRIHGNTGCNILNGDIIIDPDMRDAIQFVNMILTMRACEEAAVETEVVLALESVEKAYRAANDPNVVNLMDHNGKVVMTLRRIDVTK